MEITTSTPDTSTARQVLAITAKAVEEIKKAMEGQHLPAGAGLRIGVKGGGCSGFSYVMGFDGAPTDHDHIQDVDGIKLFVDKKSALYLEGTTLDYVETLQQKGFVFQNPNATGTCGCGSSFSA